MTRVNTWTIIITLPPAQLFFKYNDNFDIDICHQIGGRDFDCAVSSFSTKSISKSVCDTGKRCLLHTVNYGTRVVKEHYRANTSVSGKSYLQHFSLHQIPLIVHVCQIGHFLVSRFAPVAHASKLTCHDPVTHKTNRNDMRKHNGKNKTSKIGTPSQTPTLHMRY